MKSKRVAYISTDCVACGACVNVCSLDAVEIKNGIRAEVSDDCVGCGKCALVCPAGVIAIKERGEADE